MHLLVSEFITRFHDGVPIVCFVDNKARLQKFWIPREKVVRKFERECICCFLKTMAIFLLSSMPNPKHLYNSIKEMPLYHVCSFDDDDYDDIYIMMKCLSVCNEK